MDKSGLSDKIVPYLGIDELLENYTPVPIRINCSIPRPKESWTEILESDNIRSSVTHCDDPLKDIVGYILSQLKGNPFLGKYLFDVENPTSSDRFELAWNEWLENIDKHCCGTGSLLFYISPSAKSVICAAELKFAEGNSCKCIDDYISMLQKSAKLAKKDLPEGSSKNPELRFGTPWLFRIPNISRIGTTEIDGKPYSFLEFRI